MSKGHSKNKGVIQARALAENFPGGGGKGKKNPKKKKKGQKKAFKTPYFKASIYYICTMFESPWGVRSPCLPLPTPMYTGARV